MNTTQAIDFILKDKTCLGMVKKLSPLDLLRIFNKLGFLKSKDQARDLVLKVNEDCWMEPVKTWEWDPPTREKPGVWPYDMQNVEFMKRKNTAKQGLTK